MADIPVCSKRLAQPELSCKKRGPPQQFHPSMLLTCMNAGGAATINPDRTNAPILLNTALLIECRSEQTCFDPSAPENYK